MASADGERSTLSFGHSRFSYAYAFFHKSPYHRHQKYVVYGDTRHTGLFSSSQLTLKTKKAIFRKKQIFFSLPASGVKDMT